MKASIEEQLNTAGNLVYTNKGISMMPLLRENKDVLIIKKIKPTNCKKYDVVLYVRPHIKGRGHYVLHRILRINSDDTFWIVGDNCITGEIVQPKDIIGVLTDVLRDGKKISVTDLNYKLYVYFWCAPYPLRFVILRLKTRFHNACHRIKCCFKRGL